MDFESRVEYLSTQNIHLLHAGVSHDKRKPKYWLQLFRTPHSAVAYGESLSQALALAEELLQNQLPLKTLPTLDDLDL